MRRTIFCLLILLAAMTPVRAEYVPGFNLYSHSAEADLIVLAEVDAEGTARVIETLKGDLLPGSVLTGLREVLVRTRKRLHGPPDRAFLFLTDGRLVLGRAGIGWVERGKVFLLPDNWGYGISYPLEYREPTPEEFRKSVALTLADIREVARIAKLPRGPDRLAAASALLRRTRKGLDWYVAKAHTWMDRTVWRGEGYLEEIAIGLWRARVPFPPKTLAPAEVRAAWREAIGELPPGPVRRAHLWILSWTVLRPDDYLLLEKCFKSATGSREREAAGSAMLNADPRRAAEFLSGAIDVSKTALADTVLRLLVAAAAAKRIESARVTEIAADLVPKFLPLPRSTATTNLGSAIVFALGKTDRVADLSVLLALARGEHGCRGQALVELRRLARKDWEAADVRWDDHLSSLTVLPSRK